MGYYKANKVWEITSTSQNIDKCGSNSIVTFTLNLKRKPDFYARNLVTPILFLGVLNILVFVIPADVGEKMSYCITVAHLYHSVSGKTEPLVTFMVRVSSQGSIQKKA